MVTGTAEFATLVESKPGTKTVELNVDDWAGSKYRNVVDSVKKVGDETRVYACRGLKLTEYWVLGKSEEGELVGLSVLAKEN